MDHALILSPSLKGNLITSKGEVSHFLGGLKKKAQVILVNASSEEEIESTLYNALYCLERKVKKTKRDVNNLSFVTDLLERWNSEKRTRDISQEFLDILTKKSKQKIFWQDVIVLQEPEEKPVVENVEPVVDLLAKHVNHLVICYPNNSHFTPIGINVDVKNLAGNSHVILVNSNYPKDFKPLLKLAVKELKKMEDTYTNRQRIKYINSVLEMLENKDMYRRTADDDLLIEIRRSLGLKNLEMAKFIFMTSF